MIKTYESFSERSRRRRNKKKSYSLASWVDEKPTGITSDFKSTIMDKFLELTRYTTPMGYEDLLRPYLPESLVEDEIGNYYTQIGDSDTLFVCHLDNACSEYKKINHDIEGHIVATDGKTILGSDNKAGVVLLMYMINKGVPGTYYFFMGEEKGRVGSTSILKRNPEFFKKFKRCIAFDRKRYSSIITHQMCERTCSAAFGNFLIEEFSQSGLKYVLDDTGSYTDSYTFAGVIPECTNISNGTFNEHTTSEYLDIAYLERLCGAVCKVDWEKIPTERDPSVKDYGNYGFGDDDYDAFFRYDPKPSGKTYTTSSGKSKPILLHGEPDEDTEYGTIDDYEPTSRDSYDEYKSRKKRYNDTDLNLSYGYGYNKPYQKDYKIDVPEFYYTLRHYLITRYFDEEEAYFNEKMIYYFTKQEMTAILNYSGFDLKDLNNEIFRLPYLTKKGEKYAYDPSKYN